LVVYPRNQVCSVEFSNYTSIHENPSTSGSQLARAT
jgi:hypothetical protein